MFSFENNSYKEKKEHAWFLKVYFQKYLVTSH